MRISIKILVIVVLIVIIIFGCRKHTNTNPTPTPTPTYTTNSIKLAYAAKYTPLMAGNRHWHRYSTVFLLNSASGFPKDTTINLTDTTGAVTVKNDTIIVFPLEFGGGAVLSTATSNMLYFSAAYYLGYGPPTPYETWSAYYFPANDSISLLELSGQTFPSGLGYCTF